MSNTQLSISTEQSIGTWNPRHGLQLEPKYENVTLPRLLRVGMTPSRPWMYFKKDPETGKILKDSEGNFIYEGYCVDLLSKMAERLKFDYEIVLSSAYDKSGLEYGKKLENGSWTGNCILKCILCRISKK